MIQLLKDVLRGNPVHRSPLWKATSQRHLADFPECQACYSKKSLEAHHIVPFHMDPDKELDWDNLVTLCKRCHLFVGHLGSWASYNSEVNSDCITWANKIFKRPMS